MVTLSISVSEEMREWIDSQVSTGEYANISDYMRDLIRHDQREREALRLALIEGELSGRSERKIPDIIAYAKAKLKNG